MADKKSTAYVEGEDLLFDDMMEKQCAFIDAAYDFYGEDCDGEEGCRHEMLHGRMDRAFDTYAMAASAHYEAEKAAEKGREPEAPAEVKPLSRKPHLH